MNGPLEGVRVLEIANYIAVPAAAALVACYRRATQQNSVNDLTISAISGEPAENPKNNGVDAPTCTNDGCVGRPNPARRIGCVGRPDGPERCDGVCDGTIAHELECRWCQPDRNFLKREASCAATFS